MRKLVEFYNKIRYSQKDSTAEEYAILITLIALAISNRCRSSWKSNKRVIRGSSSCCNIVP